MTARLLIGDVFERMAEMPDDSVDLIVTSPPFLMLRDYLPADHPLKRFEIGAEGTPAGFLDTLLRLSAEWRRVLAPHGTLAVELGDTYSGSGAAGGDWSDSPKTTKPRVKGGGRGGPPRRTTKEGWPLAKSLTGIPTLYPWSLAYGRNLLTGTESPAGQWRVRNVLVWARPNPPVGALADKFRPATSYITVACTGPRRYFDLDAVRKANARAGETYARRLNQGNPGYHTADQVETKQNPKGAPPLDWHDDVDDGPNGDLLWRMNTKAYRGAHYATFPVELPTRIISAMCPLRVCTTCGVPSTRIVEQAAEYAAFRAKRNAEYAAGDRSVVGGHREAAGSPGAWADIGGEKTINGASYVTVGWTDCGHGTWRNGLVFDPFAGSGTTLLAAHDLGRDVVGIDLDEANVPLAVERVGMYLEVEGLASCSK